MDLTKKRIHSVTDTFQEIVLYYSVLLVLCASVFAIAEGRDFWSSLYWAGVTATSTGYGDISPVTIIGRIVAFVLMHVSVLVFGPLIIIRLMDHMNHDKDAFTDAEQKKMQQTLDTILEKLSDPLEDSREREHV
jgi:voltage-gated potassium channel